MNELHYAVVVGINRYPGISDLVGPINDAARFHAWLVDPNGGAVPGENALLVEASPADAVLRDRSTRSRSGGRLIAPSTERPRRRAPT